MLKGGYAAEEAAENNENENNSGSFMRPGVKTYYASPNRDFLMRFLPAFDMSLSLEDEDFGASHVPYRDADLGTNAETGDANFTPWYFPVMGYTYYGLQKRQFLSPLTGTKYYPAGHDPIRDTYKYINEFETDPNITDLANGRTVRDKTTGKTKTLPGYLSKRPREFVFVNGLVENKQSEWENAVVIFTISSFRDLLSQLGEATKRSDKVVITPEWPDFYYGDITDPRKSPIVRVTSKTVDKWNVGGCWLKQDPKNEDSHGMKFGPTITEEQLRGRYRIFDTENVTNFPEKAEQYQMILDYLVEDGVIPLDILEAACGRYGTVNRELRRKEFPWFDEEDADDTTSQNTVQASGTPAKKEPQTQSAINELPRGDKPAEEDEEEEDVPYDTSPKKETSGEKGASDDESGGLTPEEEKEYQELYALITDEEQSAKLDNKQLLRYTELVARRKG